MEDLLKSIEDDFDEAEGWIRIVDADWYADDLKITLSVRMHDEAHPQLWEVLCEGVEEERLTSYGTDFLILCDTSKKLFPYNCELFDVFFSKNECEPAELLGILTSICAKEFGDLVYLQRFLNLQPTVDGIVFATNGKLGSFPKPFVKALIQETEAMPIELSVLSTGKPKKWAGKEFVEYSDMKCLELGKSYIIAKSFEAERV